MTDDDRQDGDGDGAPTSALDRAFAVMLGELEDAETELTKRQSELAKELDGVSAELDRLANVKAAMLGKPVRRKARAARTEGEPVEPRGAKATAAATRAERNRERVMAYAREHVGEEWVTTELAETLGVLPQSLGPVLAGLQRRGLVRVVRERERGDGSGNARPVYTLGDAAEAQA